MDLLFFPLLSVDSVAYTLNLIHITVGANIIVQLFFTPSTCIRFAPFRALLPAEKVPYRPVIHPVLDTGGHRFVSGDGLRHNPDATDGRGTHDDQVSERPH